MNRCLCVLSIGVMVLAGLVQRTAAEESARSVQEQIDALKAGQENILKELKEIKAILQQPPTAGITRREVPATVSAVNVHGEGFRGKAEATVAIIEYSDFNCDHCQKFWQEVLPQLNEKYVASGKIRYFFRDLPEPGQAESWFKAHAARCAGEQGKFWEMHDRLFAKPGTLNAENIGREAAELGLDGPRLNACLVEGRFTDAIQRSVAGASRIGIHGTPTFIIGNLTDNGDVVRVKQVLLGTENFASFQNILDELLKAGK